MSSPDWSDLGPALIAAFLLLAPTALAAPQPRAFDMVITNGHIIGGTGSPWYAGDVGIVGGRIAAIGNLAGVAAERVIDALAKVVAPGFIDMLGQSELSILLEPSLPSKVFQGITTEITGALSRHGRAIACRCRLPTLPLPRSAPPAPLQRGPFLSTSEPA